jgi:hypothetical protein
VAELRVHRLFSGRKSTVALQDVYTVPAGKRAILKSINGFNVTGTGNRLWVSKHGNPYLQLLVLGAAGTDAGSVDKIVWIVLEPGETLSLENANATAIDVVLSGTEHFI